MPRKFLSVVIVAEVLNVNQWSEYLNGLACRCVGLLYEAVGILEDLTGIVVVLATGGAPVASALDAFLLEVKVCNADTVAENAFAIVP
jgi:hypothetical protein